MLDAFCSALISTCIQYLLICRNYKKLAKAYTYLSNDPDCHFVATNSDLTYPCHNTMFPGTGALLATLTSSLGQERPPKVIGKPHDIMMAMICEKFDLNPLRTCMIGDRLDTDIEFGIRGGVKTCLVLTGVTSQEEARTSSTRPDFIIESLGALFSDDCKSEIKQMV